jgi:hypothetical protein
MNKPLLLGAVLFSINSFGSAAPTVDGIRISWSDDGWYQVQEVSTYTEVCAGGRSCSVAPGTYVVINHSTGERFRNITVGELEGGSSVVVSGTTISWPDDGWYQVQDALTYSEVCAGGRSCSVAPGTYVVINHSSGERFSGIKVEEIEDSSSVVVSGNTISWPDDGWYQVQNSSTYESLCQGGLSCEVGVGTYTVINLSTGERFRNIVVSSNPEPVDSLITLDSYEQILRELTKLINATPMAATLSTQPATTDSGVTFVSVSTGPVEDEVFGLGFLRDYSCDAGGSIEVHTFTQPGSRKLTFTDCALQAGSFDGVLKDFIIGREGTGVTATDYSVDTDNQTRTLSGSRGASFFRGGPGRNRFWRDTDFDSQLNEGTLTLRSYELNATSRFTRPARVNESDLSVSFDVSAPWTGEQSIRVQATLQASIEPDTTFTWQTGEVVAVAEDGSQLTLTPADTVQRTFNIALAGHDSMITRQWADGFEIFCAFTDIEMCGSF